MTDIRIYDDTYNMLDEISEREGVPIYEVIDDIVSEVYKDVYGESLISEGFTESDIIEESDYRSYEDPNALEDKYDRLKAYCDENPGDIAAHEELEELAKRIRFAWADDEYDEDNADEWEDDIIDDSECDPREIAYENEFIRSDVIRNLAIDDVEGDSVAAAEDVFCEEMSEMGIDDCTSEDFYYYLDCVKEHEQLINDSVDEYNDIVDESRVKKESYYDDYDDSEYWYDLEVKNIREMFDEAGFDYDEDESYVDYEYAVPYTDRGEVIYDIRNDAHLVFHNREDGQEQTFDSWFDAKQWIGADDIVEATNCASIGQHKRCVVGDKCTTDDVSRFDAKDKDEEDDLSNILNEESDDDLVINVEIPTDEEEIDFSDITDTNDPADSYDDPLADDDMGDEEDIDGSDSESPMNNMKAKRAKTREIDM